MARLRAKQTATETGESAIFGGIFKFETPPFVGGAKREKKETGREARFRNSIGSSGIGCSGLRSRSRPRKRYS